MQESALCCENCASKVTRSATRWFGIVGDPASRGLDGGGPLHAGVRAREDPVGPAERHLPFTLPMKLKSIIAGIRSIAVFDANTVSSALTAGLFTSRRHLV